VLLVWAQAEASDPRQAQRLRDAADFAIYTPGSTAGAPLNVVGSLNTPPLSWDTDAEALRDEIEGTVTSLLALVGIAADPLSSREHVLLSNLIEACVGFSQLRILPLHKFTDGSG
jgi:hypothetical protein